MKHNWIEVTDLIYIYPDNSWKYAEEHRSWMGDDYVAIDYGIICEEHDVWAKYECPHCLLETLDPNNTLEVRFIPHAGQSFNVSDQLVKAPNQEIWAVRDRQFKFKVRT